MINLPGKSHFDFDQQSDAKHPKIATKMKKSSQNLNNKTTPQP